MFLFSDFDNTIFFQGEFEKTDKNLAAIKKWKAAGHRFCVITGRSYRSVTSDMPEIKTLSDFYILDHGSIILNQDGALVHSSCFSPQSVTKIVNFSKTLKENPIVYYYATDFEGFTHQTDNITKLRIWVKDQSALDSVAEKMSIFPNSIYKWFNAVSRHKELNGYEGLLDIMPVSSGKAQAINFLTQTEGVRPEDVITVGDDTNDYEMLEAFDGYMVDGSNLSKHHAPFKSVASLATLVDIYLKK
ncbi:HAD-IIB family hydrolase [Candidatus Saccharibacteria bacterium]|nr:HAD-IIB family hydrolase [Candidatus Saccharibacteria bacterium]